MQQSDIFGQIKNKFPELSEDQATKAVIVPGSRLLEVVDYLRGRDFSFDDLHCITAVDRQEKLELVYIFYSYKNRRQLIIKVHLPVEAPEVESLAKFYKSADWFEREVYDLFGIKFLHHPNLSRILNPADWKGFPLRKDYIHPGLIKKPRH